MNPAPAPAPQALCGVMVDIPTLTGEKIPINLATEVIKPSTTKRINGYGLPLPKEPTKRYKDTHSSK